MSRRIKIYCLLLSVIYAGLVVLTMTREYRDFIHGFNEGMEQGRAKEKDSENSKRSPFRHYAELILLPEAEEYPEQLVNTKNGQAVKTQLRNVIFYIDSTGKANLPPLPAWLSVLGSVTILLTFPVLFAVFAIPILFFKIMRAISKGLLLSNRVIRRLQWLGGILVYMFLITWLFSFVGYLETIHYLELANYEIMFPSEDWLLLILGLVTLLIAEILKVSLKMKEEQDLTI